MKDKLVLIFDNWCEVDGVESKLLFNDIFAAENYLRSTGKMYNIVISPDIFIFTFNSNEYDVMESTGQAFWVKDFS